jgi:hypothetical protein
MTSGRSGTVGRDAHNEFALFLSRAVVPAEHVIPSPRNAGTPSPGTLPPAYRLRKHGRHDHHAIERLASMRAGRNAPAWLSSMSISTLPARCYPSDNCDRTHALFPFLAQGFRRASRPPPRLLPLYPNLALFTYPNQAPATFPGPGKSPRLQQPG